MKKQNTPKPTKQQRPYPIYTLSRALQVPLKIKELNGGNPWASEELAKALEIGF